MTLTMAVTRIMDLTGGAGDNTPAAIAKVLKTCGFPADVPDNRVDVILKAGAALKKLGVS